VQGTGPNRFARQLFDGLPARYDRLAEVLSFGQNGRWRRAMVDAVAVPASRVPASRVPASRVPASRVPASWVLDVATGPGGVALQLAARTGAQVTGVDITPQMLKAAQANLARSPAGRRVDLVLGRAEDLPFADATFDALTFTYLLRYVADPAATLRELVRVVKPGGAIASLEFHPPRDFPWRPMWALYTRLVLPAAGWALGGREWFEVGRFLGPSITRHYRDYPVAWHVDAWREAGVEAVDAHLMSLGGGLVMWGRKSPAQGSAAGPGPVGPEPPAHETARA
jgi:demethylmenaquinone methyltransferase/2-methoxy-6-polyprenyl-1,4-benzoquinol methylase